MLDLPNSGTRGYNSVTLTAKKMPLNSIPFQKGLYSFQSSSTVLHNILAHNDVPLYHGWLQKTGTVQKILSRKIQTQRHMNTHTDRQMRGLQCNNY